MALFKYLKWEMAMFLVKWGTTAKLQFAWGKTAKVKTSYTVCHCVEKKSARPDSLRSLSWISPFFRLSLY